MPASGPPPPPGSRLLLLLLLLLLLISWPPPGGALALPEQRHSGLPGPLDPGSEPDARRSQEVRGLPADLLSRLQVNQSWGASSPDLLPAPAVRILTPKVQIGPEGHLLLRISRASLTQGLPEAYRVQRALLRLSPTALKSWDVTRALQRELRRRGSRAPALHLKLSPPSGWTPAVSPSAPPQLELHLRGRAARGRRSAHARAGDDCPLGPGRCCRLQSFRASLEDLGWSDWVLSPRELRVSMCVGACPSLYRSATTHAQIKARLHGLKPGAVPAPCCVPSGYDLVVLMHKTDSGVSLRTYDDLIASGCHCA